MRRAALLLVLSLTGCGGAETVAATGDDPTVSASPPAASAAPDAAPVDGAALLAAVPQAVRSTGSVRFTSVVESALDGEPLRLDGRSEGELDTVTGAGRADLDLTALTELAAEASSEDEPDAAADLAAIASTRLWWTADEMTVALGDQRQTAPRDSSDAGMLARVPAEPAGMLLALAGGRDVEVVGTEDLDGTPTTRLRTTVDPQAAVEAGLGTQAQLSIARMPSLPLEAWIGADGLPRRVVYRAQVPSLQDGRTRTMVATYDYAGWGEPVDVTP